MRATPDGSEMGMRENFGGNWSDDGAQQQYAIGLRHSQEAFANATASPFGRLGESYHPLQRKMTGPQPF